MEDLIQYIQEGEALDNATLLKLYTPLSKNPGLISAMQRSARNRDIHIRYQVWKMLPQDLQERYSEDLAVIGGESPEAIADDDEDTTDTEETDEQTATEEPQEPQELTEAQNAAIVKRSNLINQRNQLSNSLASFAESDNEGRKAVLSQIDALNDKIGELNNIVEGKKNTESETSAEPKFIKTAEEKSRMSAAEKKIYSNTLAQNRSKTLKKIANKPQDKLIPKWHEVLKIIESEQASIA
jgi:hypothetical protein